MNLEEKTTPDQLIIVQKAPMLQFVMALFFSLVWTGMLTFMVMMTMGSGIPAAMYIVFVVFFGIGLLPFIMTARKHGSKTVTINRTEVHHFFKRTILSPVEWRESLSAYSGLITTSVQINMGTSKNSNYVTFFVVDLQHPNKDRTVRLGMYRDEVSQRTRAEACSKILHKELLSVRPDGTVHKIAVEDLDKKFEERVSKSDVDGPLPDFPKSSRFFIQTTSSGFVFIRKYPMASFWSILFIGVGIMLGVLVHPGPGVALVIFGVIFMGSAFSGGSFFEVSGNTLEAYQRWYGKKFKSTILNVQEVEEIVDGHDMSQGNVKTFNICVQIKSDKGIISLAHGASPEIRSWIKKAVSKYVYAIQKQKK